jgi:hypothetical protein
MTRIRLRTDHRYIAAMKALGKPRVESGDDPTWCTQEEWDATPAAEPGDIWGPVEWYGHPGSLAGYDIACPKCHDVHGWTTARNCSSRRALPGGGFTCDHEAAHGSCWTWTGSAADGTLSASPSLHCDASIGGCGWHGFLTNGELR